MKSGSIPRRRKIRRRATRDAASSTRSTASSRRSLVMRPLAPRRRATRRGRDRDAELARIGGQHVEEQVGARRHGAHRVLSRIRVLGQAVVLQHQHVVGHDDPVEAELVAQDPVPRGRERSRRGVHRRVGEVARHHELGARVDAGGERERRARAPLVERERRGRDARVRVAGRRAVSREVLQRARDASPLPRHRRGDALGGRRGSVPSTRPEMNDAGSAVTSATMPKFTSTPHVGQRRGTRRERLLAARRRRRAELLRRSPRRPTGAAAPRRPPRRCR